MKVRVSAPSRLHFGILSPVEVDGRIYGSVGLAIKEPRVTVEVERAAELQVDGPRREEAEVFVKVAMLRFNVGNVKVRVLSAPPPHVGLGSTTQLALSIGLAVANVGGASPSVLKLAKCLERAPRSGIGTYAFQLGGFIVDGGRGAQTTLPPLIFRHSFPEDWVFVVAIPRGEGLYGAAEAEAFSMLQAQPQIVYKTSHIVLLRMIPFLVEHDIDGFGKSLTELQNAVGSMFTKVQRGTYNEYSARALEVLKSLGVNGYGQSSWGPTIYGLTWKDEAPRLLEAASSKLRGLAEVFIAEPDNEGARLEAG